MVRHLRERFFAWRHRKSRSEVVAFAMGVHTGRMLCDMYSDAETDRLIAKMMEDYDDR